MTVLASADKNTAPIVAGQCPIYVVSLIGAVERRASITQQMHKFGLAFEFVDGVMGSALTPAERAEKVGSSAQMHARIGRDLKDGEIGCALSHQKVYEKILASVHEKAFVVEDDAILLPDFPQALKAATEIDLDWLIFGCPKLVEKEIKNAWLYDPIFSLGSLSSRHRYGLRTKLSHLGTVGYMISRAGCEKMSVNYPVITVADDYPFFSRTLRVWHLRPFAIMEDAAHVSTIRHDFRANRRGLSRRQVITRTLRGMWRHVVVLLMALKNTVSPY